MLDFSEAKRCINCKIPKCVEGCPINNKIPEFINEIKNENYKKAYEIIREVNPIGAICGRICPKENQCEGNCVRGLNGESVQIGQLESAICDWARENNIKIKYDIKENNIKVAVIGSGPAGISCAVELRKLGYDVTIFEKESFLGGILMYGIPEYRLPKKIVTDVINDLLELGIKVELNTILQTKQENGSDVKTITIKDLFEDGYKAVFIGIGAENSNILPIEGNQLEGVLGANEFLKENINCKDKKVIVIGGGNVAMDSARVAKRKGADVTVIYRKLKENMPANKDEIEDAEKEKIKFIFKTNVVKINSIENENKISSVECDTGEIIETDYVIMAIGATPNINCIDKELKLTEQGLIEVDKNYETSIQNVFAGGDLVQKKSTVCMAIKNGKEAARAISEKIK